MSLRFRVSDLTGSSRLVEVHTDPEAVAQRVADLIQEVVRANPEAHLVLPAGATPVPTFRELVRRTIYEGFDLRQAHLYQLDEIEGVPPEDQRSFHAFLRRTLLDEIPREDGRDHLLDGCVDDPVDEIQKHALALTERGGPDLSFLGLGLNGHVGYNEPGSREDDEARRVQLNEVTIAEFTKLFVNRPVPARGITLGLEELRASKRVVFAVTGASKAEILRRVLTEGASSERPASWLLSHPDAHWILDEAAASRLDKVAAAADG